MVLRTRPHWRHLIGVAAAVAATWLAVIGLLYVNQRSLLYQPAAAAVAPDVDGPAIQVVRFKTADGETLVGWWLPAQSGRPTVLFFSGNAAGLAMQRGRWSRLADAGVGFLAVAYRGYDGSTGRPTEAGLHQDARAAYAWITDRVAPSDLVIHGFSLGTGVATRLASERPARALVLEAPFTSASDVAARAYPWAPVQRLMKDRFLSREHIARIRMPMLILHGDRDSVVPFAQGRALYDLARPPKRFVRMIGSDHNTLTRDGGYDHILRFLALPPPQTTAFDGNAAGTEISRNCGEAILPVVC